MSFLSRLVSRRLVRLPWPALALLALSIAPATAADADVELDSAAFSAASSAPVRIAITLDDLPGSEIMPHGYSSERLLIEIVAALKKHRVQSATGFVIGSRLDRDPHGRAALATWLEAGFELGNHSYSHGSIDELGVDAYYADVVRMDETMHALERASGQPSRWFRYPFLEEGRHQQERRLLSQAISALGYRTARVSIDFGDWAWGDPYARCLERGDARALALLSKSYIQNGSAIFEWSREAARQVLRRPFTHVLLLHANVATARNLDALLSEYERLGAVFVPLADALRDPAYAADYEGSGGHVLTLAGQRSGRALPPWQVRPLELLELACR